MSSPSGHVFNIYGFVSAFVTSTTVKNGRMVDEHAVTLPCR